MKSNTLNLVTQSNKLNALHYALHIRNWEKRIDDFQMKLLVNIQIRMA